SPSFNKSGFQALLSARTEPAWVSAQRRAAWAMFEEKAWPARNEEEWIRTDIRLFKLDAFTLPVAPPAGSAETLPSLLATGVELAGYSHTLDSHRVASHLDEKWAAKGVIFGTLDEVLATHGDKLEPHLFQHGFKPGYDKFAALHAACHSGGHVLYVPRGVVIEQPFHLLSSLTNGGVDLGHTLIVLEDGAEATVMSENSSLDGTHNGLHIGGVEIYLAPGANLRFVKLQDWSQNVWDFAHQKVKVDRDANLQWTVAALGGRLSKVNQTVELIGAGARCQVNGVLFTEGKQHVAYHTLQHHMAPHCTSDFLYEAALQDKSRTVWRGLIKVDHAAQKTDGYQRNDNLLLSNTCRADSIPGLEINADDVRCTHGSTSGKVDEELIFYAQCRGLTRKEAIRVIVSGFFQQVFDRITIESVRDALSQALAKRVRDV
ncbi:MAG TPA: Fe-S cluster assembly protein SufD, partial [Pirellulaceae bacterium]|nr:Fe-S cluster assembly protein SufD [Pirellulaceae bacterium]